MVVLREIISREAGRMGFELDRLALDRLDIYYQELVRVNRRVNLTRLVAPTDVAVKHILDSLLGLHILEATPRMRLVDVGSGAGFPGLVLKVALPRIGLTMVESARKKCRFLQDVSRMMGLTGVDVARGRAEEIARLPRRREAYDAAVARAVAEIRVLAEYCLPFVKVGGLFIAYKGPAAREELTAAARALEILGGAVERVEDFTLPGGAARSLVCIRKTTATPPAYPRKPGTPRKKPL